ncbi:hypothetical protein N7448_001330 [Penicillium atrosanguineum]|uniref:Microbial-type PARG catalytic domain-containing protein n=1 Tax=Penicillium atrosanguineum TaxID=1132637 RepID=A0A9W9HJT1_9EURO|nr:uncharacterized protein N7443_004729 [Penicillium atrosanguineum]KAJ5149752.1 hypothetical protein N7448_001330 [Penicillium atrosanguineum]KAJ5305069.1 hypothetical protein N7443_004729 [Penicillium atrosanguineum]KAJ5324535.1 hypothetical protein N7476_003135 [Penicillium atrosanguineum]
MPPLINRDMTYYPRFQNTQVKVLDCDTLDAAILIQNAHELLRNTDTGPVFVLSFANATVLGGGWMNGSRAQEEQICYRTTLIETLLPHNETRGYAYMWCKRAHRLPQIAVCSMAATTRPPIDKLLTPPKYKNVRQN